MGINKKGIFYLFAAVIFVIVISGTFYMARSYQYTNAQEVVTIRIRVMNDFVNDLNNDANKATYIAAFRSLIAMEEEIALTGQYFSDAEPIFIEAFLNGTVNGKNKSVLNDSTFTDYIRRVNSSANDVGVEIDVKVNNVTLFHKSPWEMAVIVNFTNNVTDLKGLSSWLYTKTQETSVPIFDLRDPVYSVHTLGRVPNPIRSTNFSFFVNDTSNANDTTNLIAHTNESYYIASATAPSYAMRLEGNLNASENGIESLVHIPTLQDQSLPIYGTKTIVDYIYFNNASNASMEVCFSIINMPSWFRIDRNHLQAYDIDPELGPENSGYTCN